MDSLRIAVGQPVGSDDVLTSIRSHAALVLAARADVVVFPELSVTGYRFVDPLDLDRDAHLFDELVNACRAVVTCALVGAPVIEGNRRSIAVLRVDAEGVSVAYRKTYLGDDEKLHFDPGPGATAIDIDGWRFGLGVCKDTGTEEHIEATAALDIDVYACGVVHHRTELAEQRRRAAHIASRCGAYVAMASYAGPTGEGYDHTAGHSSIVSLSGETLAEASELAGDYAAVTVTQPL